MITLPIINETAIAAINICCFLFAENNRQRDRGFVLCREIAIAVNCDLETARKLCNMLRKANIIMSKIGHSGGYYMRESPAIIDVLSSVDCVMHVNDNNINSRISTLMNRVSKTEICDVIDED